MPDASIFEIMSKETVKSAKFGTLNRCVTCGKCNNFMTILWLKEFFTTSLCKYTRTLAVGDININVYKK